jgi:fermentation-respiration switch protein FrsA (DUF1100 family)
MPAITEALNVVMPVREDGVMAYHTPISREVFEANYRILSAAKASISQKGVVYLMDAGPRIAALTLREEGRKDAQERGDAGDGGASALLAELRRLTMILAPGPNGWAMVPVDTALAQNLIDAEEWSETESALVFFTFHYALSRKAERSKIATATALILKGSITSFSAMEYAASLPTSTTGEAFAAKAASSVPC